MADKVRLQVKGSVDPEKWEDVGTAGIGVPLSVYTDPVDVVSGTLTLNYTGTLVTSLDQEIGSDTYRQTFTYDGAGTLLSVSGLEKL